MTEPQSSSESLETEAHASTVDGIVKGLRHPQWPQDPWEALRRLALQLAKLASA